MIFSWQTARVLRSARLARLSTNLTQKQLLPSRTTFPVLPYLYKSSFSTTTLRSDYRKDRLRVIEEYKRNTEALNRDLGAADSDNGSARSEKEEQKEDGISVIQDTVLIAVLLVAWILSDYYLMPMIPRFVGIDPDEVAAKQQEGNKAM